MPHPNAVLENVFGTIGAVLWSIQIIPQIWKSYRTKDTEGLSTSLMFIWALAGFFLGTYAIVQNINIPIILQPQLFSVLAALSTAQCLYYNHKKSKGFCWIFFIGFCVCFGAFEAGMTFALRAGLDNGTNAPVLLFGIISAVLLAGALLPQYWEIYKYKEVKGISMTFMAVDMAGGVFCIMSLAFKESIDILATINYAAVVLLDGVVVVLAIILNPRVNRRRAIIEQETQPDGNHLEKQDMQDPSSLPPPCMNTTMVVGTPMVPKEHSRSLDAMLANQPDPVPLSCLSSGRPLGTIEKHKPHTIAGEDVRVKPT